MLQELQARLQEVTDDELFTILDCVSEEVKRRNNLMGPRMADVRSQTVEQNLHMVMGALADLGIKVQGPKPGGGDGPAKP